MGQRDASYTLAGFVEMDESYFGAKKSGKRGRGAEGKRPVMVGVNFDEHGPKHAFMKVIERIDADTIGKTAGEKIEAGSHVKTDGLAAYHAGLAGYHHEEIIIKDPKTASKKPPGCTYWSPTRRTPSGARTTAYPPPTFSSTSRSSAGGFPDGGQVPSCLTDCSTPALSGLRLSHSP
jgi:hypothetical protein